MWRRRPIPPCRVAATGNACAPACVRVCGRVRVLARVCGRALVRVFLFYKKICAISLTYHWYKQHLSLKGLTNRGARGHDGANGSRGATAKVGQPSIRQILTSYRLGIDKPRP